MYIIFYEGGSSLYDCIFDGRDRVTSLDFTDCKFLNYKNCTYLTYESSTIYQPDRHESLLFLFKEKFKYSTFDGITGFKNDFDKSDQNHFLLTK